MNANDKSISRGELISKGVLLARKRMLHEKALHNQDVIISDRKGGIISIPAKEIIEKYKEYQ